MSSLSVLLHTVGNYSYDLHKYNIDYTHGPISDSATWPQPTYHTLHII